MGTKMSEAYYTKEQRNVNIDDANIRMNGFLKCKTIQCRIGVTFVNAHKKKYADKTIIVNPYFRLALNDKTHDANCRYNTVGQVEVIAKESHDNILLAVEEGKYNFRLNIIDEALKTLGALNREDSVNENTTSIQSGPSKVYNHQGKLDSYLSTMRKIMELRSLTETHDELRDFITLVYGKLTVKWSQFYYVSEDFRKCYTYIKRNQVTHPLCMEGIIKEIVPPSEKFKFHVIKFRSPWVEPDKDGIVNWPVVELIIQNEKVLDYIKSNANFKNIAVYSKFRVNESKVYTKQDQAETNKIVYLNIKGNLHHKNQILLY